MTTKHFHKLFGGPPRQPEAQITQREMDLAASVQKVTEDIVLRLARSIQTPNRRKKSLPSRGRRPELRRQWPSGASEPLR